MNELDDDGGPANPPVNPYVVLAERAEGLASQVEKLRDEIRRLNDRQNLADHRQKRTQRMSARTALGLALMVVLALILGAITYQQIVTRGEVAAVVDRETKTRVQTLCPFYALVLGAYEPNSRPAGPARDQYEANYRVMTAGYVALECVDPLVPPRTAG